MVFSDSSSVCYASDEFYRLPHPHADRRLCTQLLCSYMLQCDTQRACRCSEWAATRPVLQTMYQTALFVEPGYLGGQARSHSLLSPFLVVTQEVLPSILHCECFTSWWNGTGFHWRCTTLPCFWATQFDPAFRHGVAWLCYIASRLGLNRFNLYASTSPMQKSGKHPFWTTLATVALPMPWSEATVSAPGSPWIARRSSTMSLCYNTVARISITARSFTGDGVIIGALMLHLHLYCSSERVG